MCTRPAFAATRRAVAVPMSSPTSSGGSNPDVLHSIL